VGDRNPTSLHSRLMTVSASSSISTRAPGARKSMP
jgi:hypothetical protein